MREIPASERFILAQLRTRPALDSVACVPAPAPPDFEGIVWKLMTPEADVTVLSGDRLDSVLLYQVCAVRFGPNIGVVVDWDFELDKALHRASGSNPDGVIGFCERVRPIAIPERRDNGIRQMLGGLYRITVKGVA